MLVHMYIYLELENALHKMKSMRYIPNSSKHMIKHTHTTFCGLRLSFGEIILHGIWNFYV